MSQAPIPVTPEGRRKAVERIIRQMGGDPAEVLAVPGQALTTRGAHDRSAIMPAVKQAEQGERPKLPKGAQWIRHERAGSKAAQRRLRQMARGQLPQAEARCDLCGQWVTPLGITRDEKTGHAACLGCASAYLRGIK